MEGDVQSKVSNVRNTRQGTFLAVTKERAGKGVWLIASLSFQHTLHSLIVFWLLFIRVNEMSKFQWCLFRRECGIGDSRKCWMYNYGLILSWISFIFFSSFCRHFICGIPSPTAVSDKSLRFTISFPMDHHTLSQRTTLDFLLRLHPSYDDTAAWLWVTSDL